MPRGNIGDRPTSTWCFFARESMEPLKTEKQKTAKAGASVDTWPRRWKKTRHEVRRLQMRIAKAVREGRWAKVKVLTYLLTRSLAAKLLAVRRVTSNKGR